MTHTISKWPPAGGEMADRIRRLDWAGTPLGAIDGWSERLKLAVEMVIDSAGVATLACGPERILIYNDAAARLYGARHPAALGRSLPTAFPEGWGVVAPFYARAFGGTAVRVTEQPLDTAGEGGAADVFDAWLTPVRDHRGEVVAVHMIGVEVSGRLTVGAALRASEERQTFLLRLADALRPIEDARAVLGKACELLAAELGVDRAYYVEIDEGAGTAIVERDYVRTGAPSLAGCHPVASFAWSVAILRRDECHVIPDTRTSPLVPDKDRAAAAALQIIACMGAPLIKGGRLVGALCVTLAVVRQWTGEEVRLLQDVAERVWAAVERARAETAMRASEERFRQFGEASQDVLWIRDAETLQWQYLTPAFEQIYGLGRDEALAGDNYRTWLDLIVPEDRPWALERIEQVRRGRRVAFEYRVRRPADGAIRWLRNTDFPIRDHQGRVVLIGGIGHDLTDYRETELRLSALVSGIPQLVWRAADRGSWTWASPQWVAFTGQAEADSHGWGWLSTLHPDDRAMARDAWSGAEERGAMSVEYRVRGRQDHAYRWFQARATPVRDASGSVIEWLGTSTDIQDLRALQDRQQVMVRELQHRTRNLITVVSALSRQTMADAGSLGEFDRRFGDRLSALSRVQGLLSHLSAGKRVEFDGLLRSELNALGAPSDRITLDGPTGVPLRSATVQTFALALHELATNALKYGALTAPDGHLAVRWSLHRPEGGEPRLLVDWRESGVALTQVEEVSAGGGYGRELIEYAVPYQLGANTTYDITSDGVHCTIDAPVSSVLAGVDDHLEQATA